MLRHEIAQEILRRAYGLPTRAEIMQVVWDFFRDKFRAKWARDGEGRWV